MKLDTVTLPIRGKLADGALLTCCSSEDFDAEPFSVFGSNAERSKKNARLVLPLGMSSAQAIVA